MKKGILFLFILVVATALLVSQFDNANTSIEERTPMGYDDVQIPEGFGDRTPRIKL